MAKLFEFQSKKILKEFGIRTPGSYLIEGGNVDFSKISLLKYPVVLKAQTWFTGRAAIGAVKICKTAEEVSSFVKEFDGKVVKNFPIEKILAEEFLNIEKECFAGVVINDKTKSPNLIFSAIGGSGIEELSIKHPEAFFRENIDVIKGLKEHRIRYNLSRLGFKGDLLLKITTFISTLVRTAIKCETRSLEVNPVIITKEGEVVAADCHMVVDDYAVFRHPEYEIEMARELDRPPTPLDKIAFQVEKTDFRGTFYFIQSDWNFKKGDGYIGFHGAGGGGSMMAMDALVNEGLKVANYCDTSGNPPASKVYRAAKIILSQPNIDGYFGSGSGVASQEQFHSARGLLKAFREEKTTIPVVMRLGGNQEERAIKILTEYSRDISAKIECYGKDTSAKYCAERLKTLINSEKTEISLTADSEIKLTEGFSSDYQFKTKTEGTISFDYSRCQTCKSKICVQECIPKILKTEEGNPVLNISSEAASQGKCIECLACEIECFASGNKGCKIELPIKGLAEYVNSSK